MSDQDENQGYEVGYGKPPKGTQFKPGQSGNPGGRPPRSRNLKRLLQEVLDDKIEITENGEKLTVTIGEAVLRRLAYKAVEGDRFAMQQLVAILVKYSWLFEK